MKKDPDPDKRITNADEQDVAVNHSTKDVGGYDEPASETADPGDTASENIREKKGEKNQKVNKKDSSDSKKIN